jgi:signal recognition particle subunit SRP54
MFDSLAEKLQGTLSRVRGRGTLTEEDIEGAMREIRLALLEADVNFKVVKDFTDAVRARATGADVLDTLNPGQQVIKIVNDELTAMMGGDGPELAFAARPPTVIMMVGLQGSGKTTAAAKLAKHLRSGGFASVALAACDVYRPAAVEQLVKLGRQAGAEVYERGTEHDPLEVAEWALEQARSSGTEALIIDTSGRLDIDERLMDELVRMRSSVKPHHVLLVVDAMTGQEAAAVAGRFAQAVQFDAVIMTKLDGDARGGAALSVKAVTGRPISYASTGEALDQFELFHPERMAQRILGMGDVMGLIERAEREFEQDEARELERKLRRNEFGLDDFLGQLRAIRRMGPLTGLLGMIPGLGSAELQGLRVDDRELDRIEAVILSMTPEERRRPELIKGSRRLRIARGSGTNVQQVSRLIKQFTQMRTVMRQVGRGKVPDLAALMRGGR